MRQEKKNKDEFLTGCPDREEGDVPDEFLALPNMEVQQF